MATLSGRYLDGTTIRKEGRLWFANREAALLRDGNATRCGSTLRSKLMHVHHVVPLRTFADHQVAEAHALGNLITLCAYCHPAVEWATTREYAAAAS